MKHEQMKHKDLIFEMRYATWEKVNSGLRYEISSLLKNPMWEKVLTQKHIDSWEKINDLWDEVEAQVLLTEESRDNR